MFRLYSTFGKQLTKYYGMTVFFWGGGSRNIMIDDKRGEGVQEGPKKYDIISERSLIPRRFYGLYWSLQYILQGERVDRGHNWEIMCFGLFFVPEHLDNFVRFLVRQNNFGGMEISKHLLYFIQPFPYSALFQDHCARKGGLFQGCGFCYWPSPVVWQMSIAGCGSTLCIVV